MGRMKKMVGLLSLTALLTIAMSVPAFAAKKIKEVSISVSDEFKIGEDCSTEDHSRKISLIHFTTISDKEKQFFSFLHR